LSSHILITKHQLTPKSRVNKSYYTPRRNRTLRTRRLSNRYRNIISVTNSPSDGRRVRLQFQKQLCSMSYGHSLWRRKALSFLPVYTKA